MGCWYILFLSALWLLQLASASHACPSQKSLPDLIYLGVPNNCVHGTDGSQCNIFLRMAPNKENSSFVDFYMEGNLKGWVAVGFSYNPKMIETDVVGCMQDRDGTLGVINTWNPNVIPKHNVIDPSQDLMCNYSLKYEDKRLKCSFSRYSGIINPGFDYDLNGSYHLILGHSDNQDPATSNFPYHTVIPVPTSGKFNVFDYNSNTTNGTNPSATVFKLKMKKAHGSLMSISWLLLASTGLFIAMWMKPAFANGVWFQFHRALMLLSLLVALTGFICIFVANKDNTIPGLIGFECSKESVHFVFGIIVTALMLLNPIIGFIRCKPESPDRWIFNLVHGFIGTTAWILALINVGLGLSLFQNPCGIGETSSYHMVAVYLGWLLGFVVPSHIFLFALFTFIALLSHGKERYELAPSLLKPFLRLMNPEKYMSLNRTADSEMADLSSKDSKIRAAAFGIYTTVNVLVVSILVVMIGTD